MSLQGRQRLSLDGNDWRIRGFDPGDGTEAKVFRETLSERGWIPARVPGNVALDVFRHQSPGREIFYHTGVEEVQWVEHKEWWYRKSFHVPADWKGREAYLIFKGVDFRAEFWLNGKKLGGHVGMFTPVEFHVTSQIKPGKKNRVAVLIKPVPHGLPLKSRAELYDWAIYVMTSGLWQGVELISVPYSRVRTVLVDAQPTNRNRRALLKLRVRVDNPSKKPFYVQATITDPKERSRVASLRASPTRFETKGEVLLETEVDNPKLWWPRGYGEPSLYQAAVTLVDPQTGRTVDRFTTDFGIRSVKMLPNPGNGQKKEDWVLTVNGRRVFIKGMNWLPAEQFFGRLKDETYQNLIKRAADMDCNMFRIWGGGLIEKDAFYTWCNRLGILVIQEMVFANQYERVTDRGILRMVDDEIPRILEKIHNHPALVMLNGGNEMPHYPEVREICERDEPTRPFFADTGFHNPWTHQFPNDYSWWNRNRSNMHGECCVSGCFNLETVDRYIPRDEIVFPFPDPPLACEHRFKPARAKRVRMHITHVQRGLNGSNDIKEIYNLDFKKLSGELYGGGNSQYPVVDSIEVFTTSGENVALERKGAKAKASSSLLEPKVCHVGPSVSLLGPKICHPGSQAKELISGGPEQVINGFYGNEYSWAGGKRLAPTHYHPYRKKSAWVEIELPEEVTIDRIVWSRDRTGRCANNVPIGYKFMVAGKHGRFQTVVDESGDGGRPFFNKNTSWAYHRGFYGYWSKESWFENRNLELQFGPLEEIGGIENYVLASQFIHGAGMRYIAESFRRRKYESGGGFLWTLNEPWPNAAFANLIDYYGVPKAAYYFVRRAYEPVHIGAEIPGVMLERSGSLKARLWAGHEGSDPLTGVRYNARLLRISDGRLIGSASGKLTLKPDESKYFKTFQTPLKRTTEGDILGLFLRLVSSEGKVLSQNTYLFGVCDRAAYPENFIYPPQYLMSVGGAVDFECSAPPFRRFFQQPPVRLRVRVSRWTKTSDGGSFTVRVHNQTKKPAVLVSLKVHGALPETVHYEDNFFDLLPGESTLLGVTIGSDPGQTSRQRWSLEVGGMNVLKRSLALES